MKTRIAVLTALCILPLTANATPISPPLVVNAIHAYTGQFHDITSATVQTGAITAGGIKTYQLQATQGYIQHIDNTTINSGTAIIGSATVKGTTSTHGINNNGRNISNVAPGVANTDAVNVQQLNTVSTKTANTALHQANIDSQIMSNAAQSNSNVYTNQQILVENNAAQGYAVQAQNNAEQFAQGAANNAQMQSNKYAASGIAAALAMPPSPFLHPGHYALGIQGGFYGGMSAVGGRATYQITRHWSINAGISAGTGQYSSYAETVGAQWEH